MKKKKELDEKEKKLNELISEINKRQKELDEREITVNNKTTENEQKEKQLIERTSVVEKREIEYNKKVSFLEDKENTMSKKIKEMGTVRENESKKMKEEIDYLINRNKELEKELIALKSKTKKNSLMLYTKPTLIGLNNIGSTRVMNSTLQCLSQTKALTNYFLNENNKTKIINNNIYLSNNNESQLSPLYYELIQNLWATNKSNAYNPYNFMKKIKEMNPLIISGQIDDSKELIIFILNQLHKELKKNLNAYDINAPSNQYNNNNNTFNNFFKNFKENCSIISDIFFGVNQTINCINNYNSPNLFGPVNYNYEIFNCLVFPLDDVRKMKNNSNQNINFNFNQINNNIISIYDCFLFNQKKELFECPNQCNINKVSIYISPNILILILNRGKGNEYDVKIDFTETIDITQFILLKDIPQMTYDLYGVITHIGRSYFVAFCKSPVDNKWYKYNDAIVYSINNVQKEIIEFGIPDVLFYQKRK